jgi:CheY-like chemotaxis protein
MSRKSLPPPSSLSALSPWSTAEPPSSATVKLTNLPSDFSVLVVDGDGVSRKFVELAFGRVEGITVESAADGAAALEILHSTLIDVVVSETELPDTSGFHLFRRLMQERRLRSTPFVFLSADQRLSSKLGALREGVDEFLCKPCSARELVTRCAAFVDRRRKQRQQHAARKYTLAGDFAAMPFPDLVGILEMGRRSGTLAIATPNSVGELTFFNGAVVHAFFGNLLNEEAFYRLMAETEGRFELFPGDVVVEDSTRIHASVQHLMMEGARLLDDAAESRRFDDSPQKTPAEVADSEVITVRPPAITARPPITRHGKAPTAALGSHYEQAISDPFALGELMSWTPEELLAHTEGQVDGERFHVHLITDVESGVGALLPLAGPPTERWVLNGLSPVRKIFGLSFFLRYNRILDIVVVDIERVAETMQGLARRPSLAILAPPDGDFLALGTRGRVDLETLLLYAMPQTLLSLGNGTLEASLKEFSVIRDSLFPVSAITGTLASVNSDFRSVLVTGIRAWAKTGESDGEL